MYYYGKPNVDVSFDTTIEISVHYIMSLVMITPSLTSQTLSRSIWYMYHMYHSTGLSLVVVDLKWYGWFSLSMNPINSLNQSPYLHCSIILLQSSIANMQLSLLKSLSQTLDYIVQPSHLCSHQISQSNMQNTKRWQCFPSK